ncbi:MAG TPA: hypothetical protein VJ719_04340 [Chthoniobacterales bacterium]|nr:hypothetical protein [Chthoniobacterales bacterium]
MKLLTAGTLFFCFWVVFATLLGLAAGGLGSTTVTLALFIALVAAVVAYFESYDPPAAKPATPGWRYRSLLFWFLAACFILFAVRSFCWLLFIDGAEFRIQSVNNLGDLALHVTYIKTFANGVPLWPDNPIFVFSKLRYPAGVDIFNGLLTIFNVDLIRGLVWVGLLASLATFYALYRWGGLFAVAGFLFNGGVVGFAVLNNFDFEFKDYQGVSTIAWKSIPLSMFVTQRGLLYAIPAALLLLWHWREMFYRMPPAATAVTDEESAFSTPDSIPSLEVEEKQRTPYWHFGLQRGPLPFWIELAIYCTLPLFHVHTFLALSVVLAFLFLLGDNAMRIRTAALVVTALAPATFFVWLITDHFNAGSMLQWQPGWVQTKGDFKMPFFKFWAVNFGFWFPIVLWLIGDRLWSAWKAGVRLTGKKLPEDLAFLCPAVAIFLIGFLVKTAPWEWDNLKLMFWGYFLVLPYLWKHLIAQWAWPLRVIICVALFGSGFVSLFGGLKTPGYGFANRKELAEVGVAIRNLPKDARFAAYPTFNHPLLLHGRKCVLGYPGHLWTQGFSNYHEQETKLQRLMRGDPEWREAARALDVRYIFWGREEQLNYPNSKRPWEQSLAKVASVPSGSIYDLGEKNAP